MCGGGPAGAVRDSAAASAAGGCAPPPVLPRNVATLRGNENASGSDDASPSFLLLSRQAPPSEPVRCAAAEGIDCGADCAVRGRCTGASSTLPSDSRECSCGWLPLPPEAQLVGGTTGGRPHVPPPLLLLRPLDTVVVLPPAAQLVAAPPTLLTLSDGCRRLPLRAPLMELLPTPCALMPPQTPPMLA